MLDIEGCEHLIATAKGGCVHSPDLQTLASAWPVKAYNCGFGVRLFCLFSVAQLAVALAGCGGDEMRQPTYPVTGKVTMDGQPVANATIVFHAVDKSKFKWQEVPQGKSDEGGKFTIFTYEMGDGAPAADYKVGIALLDPVSDDGGDQVKHTKSKVKLPAKYANAETSGLTAKVEQKSIELPPFDLSSK